MNGVCAQRPLPLSFSPARVRLVCRETHPPTPTRTHTLHAMSDRPRATLGDVSNRPPPGGGVGVAAAAAAKTPGAAAGAPARVGGAAGGGGASWGRPGAGGGVSTKR
jgi:hypothetical protein